MSFDARAEADAMLSAQFGVPSIDAATSVIQRAYDAGKREALAGMPTPFAYSDVGREFIITVDDPSGAELCTGNRVALLKLCDDDGCEPRCGVVTGGWHILPEHVRRSGEVTK